MSRPESKIRYSASECHGLARVLASSSDPRDQAAAKELRKTADTLWQMDKDREEELHDVA